MRERGPDGAGLYRDDSGRCLLGHRRLAIIDLSEAGAQPMTLDGCTISFNGEIYNYRTLRKELESTGVRFSTASDTEVLLHLFRRYGSAMVQRLRGMFAFALWDSRSRALLLARDPYGIKPLYYSDDGTCFRFASSVRALARSGGLSHELDPAAVLAFLGWGNVPEPVTMYRGIRALPAGSTMEVRGAGLSGPTPYWSVSQLYSEKPTDTSASTDNLVRQSLLDSVRAHLVADVPVGVFLSSGIDSGVLVGLASEVHPDPVCAVTLSFKEFKGTAQDEAPLASEVARRFGAKHIVVELSAETVQNSRQSFISAMDQPSIDGLNTYWVSKAAHETGLKAVLSGLGGDELFGGYASFHTYPCLRRLAFASRIPGFAQSARLLSRLTPSRRRAKVRSLGSALASRGSTFQLIRGLFTPSQIQQLVHPDIWQAGRGTHAIMSPVENVLSDDDVGPWGEVAIAEQSVYMRNQLLRDADWASMKHSLELRVPLVDRHLGESLAGRVAASRSGGKALLARSLRNPLPDSVIHRRKTGFALPMQQWVSHDIREGRMTSLPANLIHRNASAAIQQLYSSTTRSEIHWSRAWALHCLASWLQSTS